MGECYNREVDLISRIDKALDNLEYRSIDNVRDVEEIRNCIEELFKIRKEG